MGVSRVGVLVEDKNNFLEVLYLVKWRTSNKIRTMAWVRCVCGVEKFIKASDFKRGATKSCGCKRSFLISKGEGNHGYSHHPLWNIYSSMKQRCKDQSQQAYSEYGGRGIKVCDRWLEPDGKGFLNFLEDMGERPEGMTLDRVNPDGDYCKENCRWESRNVQSFNTRKRKDNPLGCTGVGLSENGEKYLARIAVGGKTIHLGTFLSLESAITARRQAELKYYGELKPEAREVNYAI